MSDRKGRVLAVIVAILVIVCYAYFTYRVLVENYFIPPDYKAGEWIIDCRFIAPDRYELLYRRTFENGLTVEMWKEVTAEEYRIATEQLQAVQAFYELLGGTHEIQIHIPDNP